MPDIQFALNHMAIPSTSMIGLLEAAESLGIKAVELRNDVAENSVGSLEAAKLIGLQAADRGISILSINALYPFNIWDKERQAQAEELADLAAACGAQGLVLCPLNEGKYLEHSAEKSALLQEALNELAVILHSRALRGFVEPLGFPVSSLRSKAEAVAAINALQDPAHRARFSLVHDTFHHKGAGETAFFAAQTGLVHCSGLMNQDISFTDMLDGHRVLVGPGDRLDNTGQLRQLFEQGYQGFVSFEPFSEEICSLSDPITALKQSMQYIQQQLNSA